MTGSFGLFLCATLAIFAGVAESLPPQKIVGGSPATSGEFPYQVSLRLGGTHLCGGAIVSAKHVVTAAHCVVGVVTRPYTNFRIATGTVSSYGGTTHAISKVIPHPSYRPNTQDSFHDIAIIMLSSNIKFNENTEKIDLPTISPTGGLSATATGWGHTNARSQSLSWTLMKVTVKTLESSSCSSFFKGISNVKDSHICTYSGYGRGTCPGDSGGPLAYDGKLIGVVSYGIPCAVGYPDVYTNVYHYLDWIKKTMDSN